MKRTVSNGEKDREVNEFEETETYGEGPGWVAGGDRYIAAEGVSEAVKREAIELPIRESEIVMGRNGKS